MLEDLLRLYGIEKDTIFILQTTNGKTNITVYYSNDNQLKSRYFSHEQIALIILNEKCTFTKVIIPKDADIYYYFNTNLEIASSTWKSSIADYSHFISHNFFTTKEQAISNKEKLLSELKALFHKEVSFINTIKE